MLETSISEQSLILLDNLETNDFQPGNKNYGYIHMHQRCTFTLLYVGMYLHCYRLSGQSHEIQQLQARLEINYFSTFSILIDLYTGNE